MSAAGAKISEQEKLNYMLLNTLPRSYSYIGDLIDALPKKDQTVAYVKNKFEIAERKHEDENEARGTNAFTARRKSRNKKAASSAEEVVIMPESAEDPGEVQHEAADGEKAETAEAEALNTVVSTGQTEAAIAAEALISIIHWMHNQRKVVCLIEG